MSFIGFSQNETNHWYFGKNAGIDFGNGDVAFLEDGSMITPAGCSSISDDEGNLMFYTNGQTVWNRNHQIMTNGEGLSGEIDGIQSAIIVPKPNDYSTYYVIYTRENTQTSPIYFLTGVYYSEIKFDTLNPLGYVTENKDVRIAEVESTSRIAAIHHPESDTGRTGPCRRTQGPGNGATQECTYRWRFARQTGRLRQPQPGRKRSVPGRRRLCRWHGQTGPRPPHAGYSAFAR